MVGRGGGVHEAVVVGALHLHRTPRPASLRTARSIRLGHYFGTAARLVGRTLQPTSHVGQGLHACWKTGDWKIGNMPVHCR